MGRFALTLRIWAAAAPAADPPRQSSHVTAASLTKDRRAFAPGCSPACEGWAAALGELSATPQECNTSEMRRRPRFVRAGTELTHPTSDGSEAGAKPIGSQSLGDLHGP
eukprot:scaffold306_cov525-Prasinococcus_capsulatus_cf.AAC.57